MSSLLIVLAVATVTLVAVAALRQAGVPAAVALVVAGLIIGFLPFVPDVSLPPELALLGLLPLLVFDAAVTSSPTGFSRDARPIGMLAVGLVVATAFAVAAAAHWVGHLSWPVAFVLGTAVGPTDAAAAVGVARRLGLPRRLQTILEGEALFNDATALVLYAAAVTAATEGRFSAVHTALSIVYSTAAGATLGLLVAMVGRRWGERIDDPPIEIAGSILLAYAAYLPAQAIHASGVLAAVTAGLYLGWHRSGTSFTAHSRLQSAAFWQTLVFLVNAALFVLVGLSFHTFTAGARGPVGRLVAAGAVVVAAVVIVRLVWMEALGGVLRLGRRSGPAGRGSERRERVILGWSGMRGAITLAALLAVPETTKAGGPLAGRDDIIYLGFAVIIVTLVGQGMTLPLLVRRLGLTEEPSIVEVEHEARMELTRAVLDRLELTTQDRPGLSEGLTDGLRAQYLHRLRHLEAITDDDPAFDVARTLEAEQELRHDLIRTQRRALAELRERGRIGATTLRAIERDLDLEEARLSSS